MELFCILTQRFLFLDSNARGRLPASTADFLTRLATLARTPQERGEIARRVDTGQLAYAAFGLYSFSLINWLGGILPDHHAARAQLAAGLDLLFTGLTK